MDPEAERSGCLAAVTVPLRGVSYNVHRAVGIDRRREPARIVAVLEELRADIIGLQEVDWDGEDHERSLLALLSRLPGYRAVAGPNLRDHRGHYGNLLLTRLPLLAFRRIDLSDRDREPRGAIDAELLLESSPLRVIVTHFGLSIDERKRQATRLRDIVMTRPRQPTLLLGDFNDWLPGSPTLAPLLRICCKHQQPASYPAQMPLLALDRIMTRDLPYSVAVWRHNSPLARKASDHLPIAADIHWRPLSQVSSRRCQTNRA